MSSRNMMTGRPGPRKPKLVVCYICGREFTNASLPIHEPQCLDKWKIENSKLPREHRRPAPKKPQMVGGGAGDMNQAAAASARGMLVPCRGCGRQFASDRIGVHERICLKGAAPPPRAGGSGPMGSTGMPTNSQARNSSNDNGMSRSGPMRQSRQPKFVICYICGRQFTDASLPIHEPQCLGKWEVQNNLLPREQRRPRPKKPQALMGGNNMSREELQEAQWAAAKENRVPCRNCGRRFNSDRIDVHERICKGPGKGGMVGGGGGDSDNRESMNGNMTGGGIPQKTSGSRLSVYKMPDPVGGTYGSVRLPSDDKVRASRTVGMKPRTVVCYLCGREFGSLSIDIHQPQCLTKWHAENDRLPPHMRRAEPKKPEMIPISGSGAYDLSAANDAAMQTAMDSRVPCDNCGRKFNPDRVAVHQRSCKPKPRTYDD